MNFLLDHDTPDNLAHLLKHWGHEVMLLRDTLPITTPDLEIFSYACEHRLVTITCNRNHFLAIASQTAIHPGLIILIRRRTRQDECSRIRSLLKRAGESGIIGNINFA